MAAAPAAAAPALVPLQARAVLFVRLLSLMNGRSGVRLQVAHFLRDVLNKGLLPSLPAAAADAGVLSAVADACKGLGACCSTADAPQQQQQLADALATAGLAAPGVSATERTVLESGGSASAGIGSLVVVGGQRLPVGSHGGGSAQLRGIRRTGVCSWAAHKGCC